ncbi:MAG: putative undecaprenyl-phosphate N-acetylglucosaminyl 1-phosphate transferase [Alphaproteobacteria bacterium MarineAlpha11_Bin1]|nr:MAG: putative undecaprenyl-phosphate N-acetylglucosaminyl 1-phosphate transferase [Alphaproteobacteria bacterium MarineAlpha11_Bin1]|tara:strand:+ start:213 stop:1277 length:1065 start_codon:yes stop_codon:yes gene_type:complete
MSTQVFVSHIIFAIALFALSVLATLMVRRLKILDEPNHRSSHDQPIPSTGGLAIFLVFASGFTAVCLVSDDDRLSNYNLLGFALSASVIALVGFLDDLRKLKTFKIKLAAQIFGAIILLAFGIVINRVSVPFFGSVDLGWFGYLLTLIWIVGLTNIFNFMDGLNGLAAGVSVTVATFFCIVTYVEGSFFVYILCYVLAASSAGFLIFNFPRARVFMGDVGSQFIGFTFAALAVIAAEIDASRTSFLVVPLLFFNFLFDTIFTLCRRALYGENVTQPHRTHLYQLLNRTGWSHIRVSVLHFAMTALQGMGAFILIGSGSEDRILIFIPFLIIQIFYAVLVMRAARRHGILSPNVP